MGGGAVGGWWRSVPADVDGEGGWPTACVESGVEGAGGDEPSLWSVNRGQGQSSDTTRSNLTASERRRPLPWLRRADGRAARPPRARHHAPTAATPRASTSPARPRHPRPSSEGASGPDCPSARRAPLSRGLGPGRPASGGTPRRSARRDEPAGLTSSWRSVATATAPGTRRPSGGGRGDPPAPHSRRRMPTAGHAPRHTRRTPPRQQPSPGAQPHHRTPSPRAISDERTSARPRGGRAGR